MFAVTNWADLRDAYGSAAAIPAAIELWSTAPTDERLGDLWGRLCHQGTVYSASFAAVPLLAEACQRIPPAQQREALMLAAHMLTPLTREPQDIVASDAVAALAPTLLARLEDRLADPEVPDTEAVYLIEAAAALSGDRLWGNEFSRIESGEFRGRCESCGADLYFVIRGHGSFVAAQDWVRNADVERIPITPTTTTLPPDGVRLDRFAAIAGRSDLCEGIRYLFGMSFCPACGSDVGVASAVRADFQAAGLL